MCVSVRYIEVRYSMHIHREVDYRSEVSTCLKADPQSVDTSMQVLHCISERNLPCTCPKCAISSCPLHLWQRSHGRCVTAWAASALFRCIRKQVLQIFRRNRFTEAERVDSGCLCKTVSRDPFHALLMRPVRELCEQSGDYCNLLATCSVFRDTLSSLRTGA